MEQIVFVMDESGAKGYSDKREAEPFELGVAAGFLLPAKRVLEARSDLDKICGRYGSDGKLHITDLSPSQQEGLRDKIFSFLLSRGAVWTYNAVFVEGLRRTVDASNDVLKSIESERTTHLKFSNRQEKESLHAKIFTGAVQKAICFGLDQGINEFKLQIVTDPIDASVIKLFEADLDYFLSIGDEREFEAKAYDPSEEQVVRQRFRITSEVGEPWNLDLSGVRYEILTESSSLTLAADVLVNSVRYYLNQLQAEQPGADLNGVFAMIKHPLQNLLYATTANDLPWLDDALYAHPNRTS